MERPEEGTVFSLSLVLDNVLYPALHLFPGRSHIPFLAMPVRLRLFHDAFQPPVFFAVGQNIRIQLRLLSPVERLTGEVAGKQFVDII